MLADVRPEVVRSHRQGSRPRNAPGYSTPAMKHVLPTHHQARSCLRGLMKALQVRQTKVVGVTTVNQPHNASQERTTSSNLTDMGWVAVRICGRS